MLLWIRFATVSLLLYTGSIDNMRFQTTACASADADEPKALPEADPNANIPRVKLGETLRFEEMGPIILNRDGTTRRIGNWDQMTEHERQVIWKRISKRNEERRKALLEQMEQQVIKDDL